MIKKKKLILIGGGENGRPGTKYETELIDKEIISLSNKKNPNFLFISHANKYPDIYFDVMKKIYGDKFSCECIHLKRENLKNLKETEKLLNWADIVYVGGGNTLRMVSLWKKTGFDKMILKIYEKGTVISGISAGGICWCCYGNSDSRKFKDDINKYVRVSGLGIIKILFCPHYNSEPKRQSELKRMMKTTKDVPGLAMDNGTAIEILDDNYRFLKSIKNAKIRKCYYKNKDYIMEELNISNDFKNIKDLYKK